MDTQYNIDTKYNMDTKNILNSCDSIPSIPIRAPHLTDLFLFPYELEFLQMPIKN